jgi:hypothetical protein
MGIGGPQLHAPGCWTRARWPGPRPPGPQRRLTDHRVQRRPYQLIGIADSRRGELVRSSPTTHVHCPDPNLIRWDLIWAGVPPAAWTRAFMAPTCSSMPCVTRLPWTSTSTSPVWKWANRPCQSAPFHPLGIELVHAVEVASYLVIGHVQDSPSVHAAAETKPGQDICGHWTRAVRRRRGRRPNRTADAAHPAAGVAQALVQAGAFPVGTSRARR